jgi:hypothetical protein
MAGLAVVKSLPLLRKKPRKGWGNGMKGSSQQIAESKQPESKG